MSGQSETPTPYRIICIDNGLGDGRPGTPRGCGPIFLTEAEYRRQMMDPDRGWRCPICRCYPQEFDDEWYETFLQSRSAI